MAPGQLNKVVKRAALVVPALAVAGVVVATATSHGLAAGALGDAAAASAHAGGSASSRHSSQGHEAGAAKTSDALRAAKSRSAAAKAHGGGSSHSPRPKAARQAKPARRPAKSAHPALSCSGSSALLPANYEAIVSYLTAHGYTRFAAAGMAGNIFQESKGNPESVGTGGGGLIGWTPLPPGFVTGNPPADLRTQLAAILTYNQQWAQYIPALNAAVSATQAADIYMNYFERPGIPAAYNREGAAAAVASACGF
jgi:Phage tail lysozyme